MLLLSPARSRRLHSTLVPVTLVAIMSSAAGSPPHTQAVERPTRAGPAALRDDLKGRWFNFNVEAVQAFVFDADSEGLFTINSPGARLARFGADPVELEFDVPMGPGLTAVVARPNSTELWCVDSLTSSVGVFDRSTGVVTHTIPVGAGPHGLVFTASGDRAYVSCSDADRVDVIGTRAYALAGSIPIPARQPRGIARIGDTVFVVPLRSGNGSAPRGNPVSGDANDVRTIERAAAVPGANALPDRDLFAIPITGSAATDQLDASATLSGLGTTLYNLHVRPSSTELWIPHTDALNTLRRGEANFIDGQVVRNRIAIVETADGSVRTIDLDQLAPSIDVRVATPTGVTFTADGDRAFVCGFGSSRIAVLDIKGTDITWAGVIHVRHLRQSPAAASNPGHAGAGPRSVGISPDGRHLFIHNSGENSLSRVELASLPAAGSFAVTAPGADWLGWNPTPFVMVQGRVDFNRTDNSRSRTSSCASCHIDGHVDGLAWDLSVFLDPAGTPGDELHFPIDNKGPMVTQSVRRLRETGPYHWRGERPRLKMFDGAFVGLLKREVDGQLRGLGANFNYLRRYMDVLAMRPNPLQSADRLLRQSELEGLEIFSTKPVLGGLRCIDCHALPLGTSGAIVANGRNGRATTCVTPSLRGINDKQGKTIQLGEHFGPRSELGAGLGHDGAFADIEAFLLQARPFPHGGQRFDLTRREAGKLASYLEAFDTGLAPATMKQLTVRSATAPAELIALLDQAVRGNCDVVYRYGPVQSSGEVRYATGMYDPALGTFRPASSLAPPISLEQLLAPASSSPVTFLGTPLWSGLPMGIDRDIDGLLDMDEIQLGTGYENHDTDGDGFPDGYELVWGMDPLSPDRASPDLVAPDWVAPPTVVYATQNTVKFEFHTTEPARVSVAIGGGPGLERRPLKPHHDDSFAIAMGDLEPGQSYEFELTLLDVADNRRVRTFSASTIPTPNSSLALVDDISLSLIPGAPGSPPAPPALHALVRLALDGASPPELGYNAVASVYHTSSNGLVVVESAAQTWLVAPDGMLQFLIPLPVGLPAGELIFTMQRVDAPPGAPVHATAKDRVPFATLDY